MHRVLAADRAELLDLEAVLELLLVLQRAVVGLLAHRALELDHVVLGHSGRKS